MAATVGAIDGVVEDESKKKGIIRLRGKPAAMNTTKQLWAGVVAAMVSRLKLEYMLRGEQKNLFELIKSIASSQGLVPSTSLATSDPETVFDIKYFSRDQRCNRPPIRRTMLNKDDIVKAMKEKSFDVADFTMVYLTTTVEEDYNACGGGYCK
ncbi:unnamed protein product [Lactuca virosa]|uniref:Uncharacterized protein n=1 Tax=Lactuca virosa TaxID=75947 RepID=A0AAU9M7U9_9ASTR|nr:unnamed protein product [Lactuca virosa]